jgi:predicted secreted protein
VNWVEGVVVYVLVWWVVVFAVLPWGVRAPTAAEIVPGQAPGAPVRPKLWLKAGITTIAAAIIWLIIWAVIRSGLISFRGA